MYTLTSSKSDPKCEYLQYLALISQLLPIRSPLTLAIARTA